MKSRTIIDMLDLPKGTVIVLGRKQQILTQGGRLELRHEQPIIDDDDLLTHMPVSATFSVYLEDKLFSVTRPSGNKHFSASIFKPLEGGPLQLRLVKKYTEMANSA